MDQMENMVDLVECEVDQIESEVGGYVDQV